MNAMILKLEDVGRHDVSKAGGKGANLGELAANAFPIPPGFIISTDACLLFFKTISLDSIFNMLRDAGPDDIQKHCVKIQEKILNADIPEDLSRIILSAYDELEKQRTRGIICAVRSSATAEDLGDASFAGQHATYYYVSRERLLAMVKHCWASLWNPEAAMYRSTHGIDHTSILMAVVVQEMVLSDVSGITFTANPVSGSKDEIVTESSWGMGAAIVDGRVTPDHYVIEKKSLRLLEKRVADKRFMVPPQIAANTKSRLHEVPHELRKKETLTTSLIETATRWALKAQNHFGSPQDVEWAIAGGEYFMLQSRPITAMGREDMEPEIQGRYVLFKPLFENFTDPVTPLTSDCFQFLFTPPLMQLIKGRLYVNVNILQKLLPLKISDEQLADFLYEFGTEPPVAKVSLIKLPFFLCFLFIAYLVIGVGFARTCGLPADFMDRFRNLANKIDRDDSFDILKSLKHLLWWSHIFEPIGNLVLLVNFSATRYIFHLGILKKLIHRWLPDLDEDAASLLCSGTKSVLSAEMGRGIWDLAKAAKSNSMVRRILKTHNPDQILAGLRDKPEATDFLNRLDAFMKQNGHRGLKELELRSPRWEENPAPILGMIRNYMLVDSNPDAHEKAAEKARLDLEKTIQKTLEKFPLEKSSRFRWRIIRHFAYLTKYFARMRENSRFYHIMGFYIIRKKICRIEESFIHQGKLKCRDDIFFLHLNEIDQMETGKLKWEDVEAVIRERRMEHIRLSKINPPKTFGIQMKASIKDENNDDEQDVVLKGQPASPGKYEGIARVILDPSMDVELRPGEILVAPYTDPAWTPLFLTAGATVVEVGSYLSHAGTVAREFGMPCVVDLPDCTTRIQTGAKISVDGDTGIVRLLNEMEG